MSWQSRVFGWQHLQQQRRRNKAVCVCPMPWQRWCVALADFCEAVWLQEELLAWLDRGEMKGERMIWTDLSLLLLLL